MKITRTENQLIIEEELGDKFFRTDNGFFKAVRDKLNEKIKGVYQYCADVSKKEHLSEAPALVTKSGMFFDGDYMCRFAYREFQLHGIVKLQWHEF